MIWKEKQWLLISLGVLLLANVIFFFTYRVQYQERVDGLDASLQETRARLAQVRRDRLREETSLAAFQQMSKDIQFVYNDWWSSPRQRLTDLLMEMNRLESRSQLSPRSTSYALAESEKKSFGNSEMGISFSVQGTYAQVRQLINLIELSRHFIVIDSITIGGSSNQESQVLTLSLQLKTLFHEEPLPASNTVAENRN